MSILRKAESHASIGVHGFFNPSFTAEINRIKRIAVNLVRENLCVRTCAPVNLRPKRNARLFTVINVV